jgi:hypothetical protein
MRQGVGEGPPAAVWIIGLDDSDADYQVLYADDRGVSRSYELSLAERDSQMLWTTPEFPQRFDAVIEYDGRTISGAWKKSSDGGATWEHDFKVDDVRPHLGEG